MRVPKRKIVYLLISVLIILSVVSYILPKFGNYHMHIYENDEPSDNGMREIKTCYSFSPDFKCVYEKPISGSYLKAVVFDKDELVSDSGWKLAQ